MTQAKTNYTLFSRPKIATCKNADPIFAAIERHRTAYIAWMEPLSRESRSFGAEAQAARKAARPYARAVERSLEEMGKVIPTTMDGVTALLAYIDDVNCDRILPENARHRDDEGNCMGSSHLEWPDGERKRTDVGPNAAGFQPEETWPLRIMRNIHTAILNIQEQRLAA